MKAPMTQKTAHDWVEENKQDCLSDIVRLGWERAADEQMVILRDVVKQGHPEWCGVKPEAMAVAVGKLANVVTGDWQVIGRGEHVRIEMERMVASLARMVGEVDLKYAEQEALVGQFDLEDDEREALDGARAVMESARGLIERVWSIRRIEGVLS